MKKSAIECCDGISRNCIKPLLDQAIKYTTRQPIYFTDLEGFNDSSCLLLRKSFTVIYDVIRKKRRNLHLNHNGA